MEDVLDVYQRPYNPKRPQVCLDEIQKALRSTPRGSLPLEPGQPKRQDHEYQRHGKCSLFLAVEPLQGFRRVWVSHQRTKLDSALVLQALTDEVLAHPEQVGLVDDNLSVLHAACLYARLPPAQARRIASKIEWDSGREHASWLNIAECELSVLRRQCLKSRLPD